MPLWQQVRDRWPRDLCEAIMCSLPQGPRQRDERLKSFVMHLKDAATRHAVEEHLELLVYDWWRLAVGQVRTKDFGETRDAFFRKWRDIDVPMSDCNLFQAQREAVAACGSEDRRERLLAV